MFEKGTDLMFKFFCFLFGQTKLVYGVVLKMLRKLSLQMDPECLSKCFFGSKNAWTREGRSKPKLIFMSIIYFCLKILKLRNIFLKSYFSKKKIIQTPPHYTNHVSNRNEKLLHSINK